MKIHEALGLVRQRAVERGEFLLRPGESINDAVVRERVAARHGVYVVSTCRGNSRKIVYIGKAGTVQQNGQLKKQGLRKRLTMKQEGMYRKEFFRKVMTDGALDGLHFEWLVTFAGDVRVPPFLAEAQLMAAHLESFGQLPTLNRSA